MHNQARMIAIAAVISMVSLVTPVQLLAESQLEEIVVTATRSGETNLQETPLSITAYTAEALERSGMESIQDLAALTPGLSISQNANRAQAYIRGVGTNLVFPGSDSSVTVHLDGVYLGRPGMLFADFIDLERVEVLRGPQGTLYGRNSAGGTINLVPKLPGDTPEAEITATFGNYNRIRLKGALRGPLVEGKVFAGVSVLYSERDGYVKNIAPNGDDLIDEDTKGISGVLRFLPTDKVEIRLSADYLEKGGSGPTSKQTGLLFDGTPSPGFPTLGPANVPADFHTVNIPFGSTPTNTRPKNDDDYYGYTGRLTFDLSDNLELSSLTSFRGYESDLGIDTDYSEITEAVSLIFEEQDQFSQEFQLTGRFDRIGFVAGLFYYKDENEIFGDIHIPSAGQLVFGNPDFRSDIITTVDTDAWAAFVEGSYDVSDRLTLTAGVRYSEEEKVIDQNTFLLLGGNMLPGANFFADKDNWTATTPKIGIDYKSSDNMLLYASITRGFKSGGYNFSVAQSSFDPEFVWAYEIGIKSDWLDDRFRINASGFFYDYTDLQVQQFVVPAPGAPARVEITNATSADIAGFEVEMNALPIPELELSAGIGYLDATYNDFITQRTGVPGVDIDVAGNSLAASPEWSFSLAGQYTFTINSNATVGLRLEYQSIADQFYTPFNDPVAGQKNYNLLNARIILTSPEEHWRLTIFGENLTDEDYTNAIQDFTRTGIMQNITPPLTWGITLSYRR